MELQAAQESARRRHSVIQSSLRRSVLCPKLITDFCIHPGSPQVVKYLDGFLYLSRATWWSENRSAPAGAPSLKGIRFRRFACSAGLLQVYLLIPQAMPRTQPQIHVWDAKEISISKHGPVRDRSCKAPALVQKKSFGMRFSGTGAAEPISRGVF